MKTIFFTLLAIVGGLFLLGLSQSDNDSYQYSSTVDKNNFDGSYTIPYSESACGQYGYNFKLKHQRDGLSSQDKMRKSNCRLNAAGAYEGYIYASQAPNLRIFWVAPGGTVIYRD